jgi:hypothetical protein
MSVPRRRVLLAVLPALALLGFCVLPGSAVELASLRLGTLEGAGWTAHNLTLQVGAIDSAHARLLLQADSAMLPEPYGRLTDLNLECSAAVVTAAEIDCPEGVLTARSTAFGRQHIRLSFSYRFSDGRLNSGLRGIRLLGGQLATRAEYNAGGGWRVDVEAAGLSLVQLTTRLATMGYSVPALEGAGSVGVTARVRGAGSRVDRAELEVSLVAPMFSNDDGSLAAEDLDVLLKAKVRPVAAGWNVVLDVTGKQGGLYVDPVFIAFPSRPVRAHSQLDWYPASQRLELRSFEYHHPDSVLLEGHGRISLDTAMPLEDLQLEIREAALPSVYETYLRPWLTGTALGDLDTAGRLSGRLQWQAGKLAVAQLELEGVSLEDREERFGLTRAGGRIDWSDDTVPRRSGLHWESGSLYRVGLGPARLAVESVNRHVRLLEAARIPVLDGALQVDEFFLEYGHDTLLNWQFDGFLSPVSMQQLSLALGWPELAGRLSGVIPEVRYKAGDLEVGGILLVRVFDGEVTLRNLRLERPLGVVPRLRLDARIDNIDLETLTRTFSFGRIEGRLDGRIDGLDMESWRPVAFDAVFATPDDDRSRHRISQKAVDNIASIGGGGMGGALSRGFLRFLEEFPYDKLGIRCRLENGVCAMGGVAEAANGYYLVKGRLIPPRLDVIGYADRVDWESLIAQIMAVTQQQNVVVE